MKWKKDIGITHNMHMHMRCTNLDSNHVSNANRPSLLSEDQCTACLALDFSALLFQYTFFLSAGSVVYPRVYFLQKPFISMPFKFHILVVTANTVPFLKYVILKCFIDNFSFLIQWYNVFYVL